MATPWPDDAKARPRSDSTSEFPQLTPLNDALLSSSAPSGWVFNTSSLNSTSSFAGQNPSSTSSAVTSPLQISVDSSVATAFWGRNETVDPFLASPLPLELPESVLGIATQSNLDGPIGNIAFNKAPGLMRRLSRGAANKLTRRRSSNPHDRRDHSSGPVIMRRRSDSKTSMTKESALDSSHEEDDSTDVKVPWSGPEGTSNESRVPMPGTVGVAPKVDPLLQCGSLLIKVTKQKKKQKTYFLDVDAAKVYWDLSNPSKRFYIDDIKEIRLGKDARNYREEQQVPDDVENLWFTIIFANPEGSKNKPLKAMHLIAPNLHVFELWTGTLEQISRYRIGLMVGLAGSGQSETILRAHWQREIGRRFPGGSKPTGEEHLDLGAVENLCHSLHINCSKIVLRSRFARVDEGGKGRITFSQFQRFVQHLKEREDVRNIFGIITKGNELGLTVEEFFNFLRDVQGEDVDSKKDYWTSVFEKYVRRSRFRSQSLPESPSDPVARMNLDAFSSFLLSAANSIFPDPPSPPKFEAPLNDYFISSSHNTYLLGRQVAGASSTEAYITSLQKGCRCVEIDCWDGAEGRPIVSHGRTMTSSVLFSDCIDVINRYAFFSSDYPLILSLEVHCNAEQQLAMASIMKDIFGEKLLLGPLRTDWPILPSPEALKGRILVKVKTSDECEENELMSPKMTGRERSSSSPFLQPAAHSMSSYSPLSSPPIIGPIDGLPPAVAPPVRTFTGASLSSTSEESDVALAAAAFQKDKKKMPKSRIVKGLADLGVYTRGYKWRSFEAPESKRYNHIYSFAERSFEALCRDPESKALLEAHNRLYLTRVYPSGYRLRSTNFNPNIFWRRGVQMVALNWQTYDVGMQMNQAMFAAGNDRTGYVLKPESLRVPPSSVPTDDGKPKVDRQLVRFCVDVISAQQLPRSRGMGPEDSINPYIEIEILSADDKKKGVAFGEGGVNASNRNGLSGIGLPHRRRTKIEQQNGFNPVFGDQFKFSLETKYPDLVFVRWIVWSSVDGRSFGANSVQLATFTAKLSSLCQGYRYLPLYDGNGDQYLFSTLFCKITKLASVPAQKRLDLEETRNERKGIFRQLGQTMFKRALSTEREKELARDRAKVPDSTRKSDSASRDVNTTTSSSSSSLPTAHPTAQ